MQKKSFKVRFKQGVQRLIEHFDSVEEVITFIQDNQKSIKNISVYVLKNEKYIRAFKVAGQFLTIVELLLSLIKIFVKK